METKIDPIEKAIEEVRAAVHKALTGSNEPCSSCGEVHNNEAVESIEARVFLIDANGELIVGAGVDEVPPAVVQANIPILFNDEQVFAVLHVFETEGRKASFEHLPEEEAKAKTMEFKKMLPEQGVDAEEVDVLLDQAAAQLGAEVEVTQLIHIYIATRASQFHVVHKKLPDDQGLGEELINSYRNPTVQVRHHGMAPMSAEMPKGAVLH